MPHGHEIKLFGNLATKDLKYFWKFTNQRFKVDINKLFESKSNMA